MTEAKAAAKTRYREYETIYLMKSDVSKEAAAKIAQRVEDVVKREGSKLIQVETWGRRQMAFAVGRHRRGSAELDLPQIGLRDVDVEPRMPQVRDDEDRRPDRQQLAGLGDLLRDQTLDRARDGGVGDLLRELLHLGLLRVAGGLRGADLLHSAAGLRALSS